MKGRQAYMQQNPLNAESASVEYLNAENKDLHVLRVMKALTKELLKGFYSIYACRPFHFLLTDLAHFIYKKLC